MYPQKQIISLFMSSGATTLGCHLELNYRKNGYKIYVLIRFPKTAKRRIRE
jgi:hypothetical protein